MPRWTYQSANEFLVGRRKQHGNIAPYTYLERDGDMIVMKYGVYKRKDHSRELVRLYPDGRIQLTCPYNCPSIRDRLNWCVGYHRIENYLGYWALNSQGVKYSFQNGMILHPDGSVTGFDPISFDDKIKAHLKRTRERNKLHTVQAIGELSVGDIVFHHKHEYKGYDRSNGNWKPIWEDSVIGPLKVKRLRESETRGVIWLTGPNGEDMGYNGVTISGMKLKKNEFLSAVEGAAKTLAAK